jgi:hypothetical protein
MITVQRAQRAKGGVTTAVPCPAISVRLPLLVPGAASLAACKVEAKLRGKVTTDRSLYSISPEMEGWPRAGARRRIDGSAVFCGRKTLPKSEGPPDARTEANSPRPREAGWGLVGRSQILNPSHHGRRRQRFSATKRGARRRVGRYRPVRRSSAYERAADTHLGARDSLYPFASAFRHSALACTAVVFLDRRSKDTPA